MSVESQSVEPSPSRRRPSSRVPRVERVERVSPTFVRITFGSARLRERRHARPGSRPAHQADLPVGLRRPARPRGRRQRLVPGLARGAGGTSAGRCAPTRSASCWSRATAPRLVIDFVLHLAPGASGPASRWASGAALGDELLILGPRRGRTDGGGIEYSPGDARTVLLAGDETAAPAIARILEDVRRDVRGIAFIEVPEAGDILRDRCSGGGRGALAAARGTLARRSAHPRGARAISATQRSRSRSRMSQTEDPVWETPRFSGLGEELAARRAPCRTLLLDRGRERRGHHAAPPPREGSRHRPGPGRVHGLLAPRRRHARLSFRTRDRAAAQRDRPSFVRRQRTDLRS